MSEKDLPRDDDASTAGPGVGGDEKSSVEEAFFDEEKVAEIKAQLKAEDEVPGGFDGAVEGEDELARIMSPRRAVRHPLVASVVICASLFGMYWLWDDFRFFLRSSDPEPVGPVSQALKQGKLTENTYVTLRGQAVPQTMANGKYSSFFGGASKRKVYWFILKDTGNRVVVRSFEPLITNQHKPGPSKFRPGIFTGRLRRLDRTNFGRELRAFYRKLSSQSKALQRDRQLTASAVLRGAGQPQMQIKDVQGNPVTVKQDTLLAIFATYPGDFEFKVHTGVEDLLKGVVVQAGQGAKKCGKPDPKTGLSPSGRGGSVWIQIDPKSVGLDHVARVFEFTAGNARPGAKPGDEPDDGKDVVLGLPPGTEVYNAVKRDCAKVCAQAPQGCKRSCSTKKGVQITPDAKGRILVAVGGRCGGYAGEKHEINLRGKPFEDAQRAEAFVASLGYPYVLVEDASKTPRKAVNFVLRLSKSEAQKMVKRQNRSSPYNIAPRYEVLYVKWRHLRRQGPNLLLTRTKRGYPQPYVVTETKHGKRLVAEALGSTLSLAPARIQKAELSLLLELPKDAFVLEESIRPGSMWTEPFLPGVPIFYLLLAAFVLFNLLAIRAYFRG